MKYRILYMLLLTFTLVVILGLFRPDPMNSKTSESFFWNNKVNDNKNIRKPEEFLIEAFEKLKNLLRDENEFINDPRNLSFNPDMLEILSDQSQKEKNLKLANYIRKIGDELKNILE